MVVKVLTQPRITLFLEDPGNKAKPRAEYLPSSQTNVEKADNIPFDKRVMQGAGGQEEKEEEDNVVKDNKSPPKGEMEMEDNTVEGKIEEIATPSIGDENEKEVYQEYTIMEEDIAWNKGENMESMDSLEMGGNRSNECNMMKNGEETDMV